MSTQVNRSREEGAALRPFKGLKGFEDLLLGSSLVASTLYGEIQILANESRQINGLSLERMGYILNLEKSTAEVADTCQDFGVNPEEIALVVMVRDKNVSTLHESEILKVVPGSALNSSVVLVDRDQPRCRLMTNQYTGFEFEAFLILKSDIPPKAFKPRSRGTILAKVGFNVNIIDKKGGLKPYPLTDQVREENDLPAAVWIWVEEQSDSLLEATSLKDAFRIYVDEEILNLMGRLSGPVRAFALQTVIMPAITQIVLATSIELNMPANEEFIFDGNSSAVLRLLFQKLKKTVGSLSKADFVALLRDKPSHAVAYALAQTTGPTGTMKDIKKWINDLIGENDVPAT